MPNITLAISKDLQQIVKKHDEINWSEIARRAMIKEAEKLEKESNNQFKLIADEKLLARDWNSKEDEEAWKDL